jgi:hypothetical protein
MSLGPSGKLLSLLLAITENIAQEFLHASLYHQGFTSCHQHEGVPKEKSQG